MVKAPAGNAVNPVPFIERASVAATVRENPFRSNTAPDATVVPAAVVPSGPLALDADEIPSFNVPALMVVAPV